MPGRSEEISDEELLDIWDRIMLTHRMDDGNYDAHSSLRDKLREKMVCPSDFRAVDRIVNIVWNDMDKRKLISNQRYRLDRLRYFYFMLCTDPLNPPRTINRINSNRNNNSNNNRSDSVSSNGSLFLKNSNLSDFNTNID